MGSSLSRTVPIYVCRPNNTTVPSSFLEGSPMVSMESDYQTNPAGAVNELEISEDLEHFHFSFPRFHSLSQTYSIFKGETRSC